MVPVTAASGTGLAGIETRVMWEGSGTPYSRAAGSLNPTGGQKLARPGAPQLAGTSRKSRIFSTYCPLVAPRRDPHMGFAQAPRGCASKPVRHAGRTVRMSLNHEVTPCDLSILLPSIVRP